MMAILMGTYYGFYLPSIVDQYVAYKESIKVYVYPFFIIVFQMNAIVNPFIYAWMNKDFNDAFRKMLRIKSRAHNYPDIAAISDKSS